MINKYYLLDMEDKDIVKYSQIVENEAIEFNNTGKFICKTFIGVINDMVMAQFTPIKIDDLKLWIKENNIEINK